MLKLIMARNSAFTLLEMVIVIIIIGVLATLGFSQFGPVKESALDSEAKANLKLVMAGERIYRMETGNYYVSVAPHDNNINTTLKLYLPTAANRNWNYTTQANNAATPPTCCAQAQRNGGDNRNWRLRNTETEPLQDGTCL